MLNPDNDLLLIAQIIAEREAAKLAQLNAQEAALRQTSENLRAARRAAHSDLAWMVQGNSQTWRDWSDAELGQNSLTLARVLASKPHAMQQARRAIGRCIALEMALAERVTQPGGRYR